MKFFQVEDPRWGPRDRVKKEYQKTLILVFEVIEQPPTQTTHIWNWNFFRVLAHCVEWRQEISFLLFSTPPPCNAAVVVHNTAKFEVWCGRKKSFTFFFSQQKKNELNQIPNQNGNDIYSTISILGPREGIVHGSHLMRQD